MRLLDAWNPAINLTRVSDPLERATRHLLDSLVAAPHIARLLPSGGKIADLGSGGGFPGVPLAARLLSRHDGLSMTLIESIGKKVRFLEAVTAASGLAPRLRVAHARAEDLAQGGGVRFDLITARAIAPLSELIRLAAPILTPTGSLLAWKRAGEGWDAELSTASSFIGSSAIEVIPVNVAALEGALLVRVTPHESERVRARV
ncbi:MAG: 16S rRNA (guanine(527)-N(7))-methyltransferase RsmG [Chloroflexi bacterium]|nr:16S rRNA (guanine(527)-N(7))-methyltransferase RsmG [Chloroflexota bacterium]